MLSLMEDGGAATPPRTLRLASITGLLLCCAPLLVLTVRGWANAVLFLGCLMSSALLLRADLPRAALTRTDRRYLWAMIVALASPLAAAVIGAALRGNLEPSQFDAPSRFLVAIPIFLLVLRARFSPGEAVQWLLPVALVLALGWLEIEGPDPRWADRHTTRMVDPLVFGYLTLSFGLMCLTSIGPQDGRGRARLGLLVRAAGVALGLYLSIRSGSRTGWLAVPIVVGVWVHHHWGRGHPLATLRTLLIAFAVPLAAYLLVPPVTARVNLAVREAAEYSWNTLPAETSIGLRITYLRIATDVFALHPLSGVGDTSRVAPAPASAFPYASKVAVQAAFSSAFHNQVVSNAVRNGIAGLLSTLALLVVPLVICARGLRRGQAGAGKDAVMGLAFCTCLVVSSLSTEIVDLKFAASFYAVMTALFCGAVLAARSEPVASP